MADAHLQLGNGVVKLLQLTKGECDFFPDHVRLDQFRHLFHHRMVQADNILPPVFRKKGFHVRQDPAPVLFQVLAEDVYRLALKADIKINLLAQGNPRLEYMGSTLLIALCTSQIVCWTHVGDSRMYLFQDKRLRQITKDQTMAQFLADEGEIPDRDVASHPMQVLLEQSLGSGDCEPVSGNFPVMPGDRVLVCSDGLYAEISNQQIARIFTADTSVEERVNTLVKTAYQAGGNDNITVVAVDII